MTLDDARTHLTDRGAKFHDDGSITGEGEWRGIAYFSWTPREFEFGYDACLDGDFTADDLEAIAVWMRAHEKSSEAKKP